IDSTDQSPCKQILESINIDLIRYEWRWKKSSGTGHLNAKKMPMKNHENVLVFYKKLPRYNPQKTKGDAYTATYSTHSSNYGKQKDNVTTVNNVYRYQLSVQKINTETGLIPTHKPV